MSRGRKRGRSPRQGCPISELQAMKPNDPQRPAIAAAVLILLEIGKPGDLADDERTPLTPRERIAATAALTQADYRRRHGADETISVMPAGAARPTLRSRDHFVIRRTATLDGGGIRWTNDMVRERLASVMDTLRRMRFPSDQMPSTKVAAGFEIARTPQELWDLLRYAEPPPERPAAPTPRELQEMDDTLPWLFAVMDWRHRLAASLRASTTRDGKQTSWRAVAAKLSEELHRMGGKGIDHKTAARWEERAVSEIVASLSVRRVVM